MAEFWLYVFVISGIYTIFALGLMVQLGIAGLPNFGHAAFMAISAYTMAITVIRLGFPMIVAAPLGIIAATVFGALLAAPAIRLREDYLAIVTIAAGEIVRYLTLNMTDLTGGSAGTTNLLGPSVFADYNGDWRHFQGLVQSALSGVLGQPVTNDFAMACIVWPVAIILLAVVWYMVRSPWGRVLRSIRDDEEASKALGKDVFRYKLQAFCVGAALAGLAGLFMAWENALFTPADFSSTLTFYAFMMVILGGKTNVWAMPVGALLFSIMYAGTRFLDFWPLSLVSSGDRSFLRLIIVGIALVALFIWRPQGLLGNKREVALE